MESTPKISKLAALAAARKKKENEKNPDNSSQGQTASSVALLDKLSGTRKPSTIGAKEAFDTLKGKKRPGDSTGEPTQARKYPIRPQKTPTPPLMAPESVEKTAEPVRRGSQPSIPILTTPSLFAQAMFGSSPRHLKGSSSPHAIFSPLDAIDVYSTEPSAFAGPSPDDIVSTAQNSKGVIRKVQQKAEQLMPIRLERPEGSE